MVFTGKLLRLIVRLDCNAWHSKPAHCMTLLQVLSASWVSWVVYMGCWHAACAGEPCVHTGIYSCGKASNAAPLMLHHVTLGNILKLYVQDHCT